jgi:RNA polymerase sigma factor (sigma-70 family)
MAVAGEHGGGFEQVVAALVRLCGVRAHRGTTGNGRLAVRYDLGRGSPAGWAPMIARRRAIDRVRSATASARERRAALALSLAHVSQTPPDSYDRERLRRCLAGLSAPQREAIMLAFYSGHRYREVADMLGIPVGTVKSRIRAGLIKLRDGMHNSPAGTGPQKRPRVQPHYDDQPPQRQRRVSRAASAAFMAAGRPGRPAVPGPPGVIRPTYPAHAHGLGVRCGVGAGSLVRPLEAGEKITVCSALRARFAQRGAAA